MEQLDWKLTGKRYQRYRFSPEIRTEIDALKPDNWHAFVALAADYVVIATCIWACVGLSWWLYPIAVLVIGARQRGLSTVLHDSAHGVCASNRTINKFLGTWLTAYPIFQRHYAYKKSHVQTHHPYLGDPTRDPDLIFFMEEGAYQVGNQGKYLWNAVVLPILGSRTIAYLKYLIKNRYKHIAVAREKQAQKPNPQTAIDNLSFFIFWASVVVVAVYTGTLLEVFLFWVVPYLTSFHILGWFIELSEHTPLIRTESVDLYMTRNRKSTGLEKFLTGIHNDHHHLDHHLDPRTPFWLLPKAHEIRMRDENYAAIDRETGGLFVRGKNGAPSALTRIMDANRTGVASPRKQSANSDIVAQKESVA